MRLGKVLHGTEEVVAALPQLPLQRSGVQVHSNNHVLTGMTHTSELAGCRLPWECRLSQRHLQPYDLLRSDERTRQSLTDFP